MEYTDESIECAAIYSGDDEDVHELTSTDGETTDRSFFLTDEQFEQEFEQEEQPTSPIVVRTVKVQTRTAQKGGLIQKRAQSAQALKASMMHSTPTVSPKKRRSKKSPMWNHFVLNDAGNVATCVLCSQEIKYSSSTTIFLAHLDKKHSLQTQPEVKEVKKYNHNKSIYHSSSSNAQYVEIEPKNVFQESQDLFATQQDIPSLPTSSKEIETKITESQDFFNSEHSSEEIETKITESQDFFNSELPCICEERITFKIPAGHISGELSQAKEKMDKCSMDGLLYLLVVISSQRNKSKVHTELEKKKARKVHKLMRSLDWEHRQKK